jgi:XTP/dITP diphosphohydrolase
VTRSPSEPALVLASRNKHKVIELSRILKLPAAVAGLDSFPEVPDVPETGETFADNALLKARAVAGATGLPAVADDSGLCVNALNGMPGIFSARWSGRHGDDAGNLDLVLGQVADVPDGSRGAQFVCVAALVLPGGGEWTMTGVLTGSLTRAPRGNGGFGYDPIFLPDGMAVTTAELSPDEKDEISHRGRAFRALAPVIGAHLG